MYLVCWVPGAVQAPRFPNRPGKSIAYEVELQAYFIGGNMRKFAVQCARIAVQHQGRRKFDTVCNNADPLEHCVIFVHVSL